MSIQSPKSQVERAGVGAVVKLERLQFAVGKRREPGLGVDLKENGNFTQNVAVLLDSTRRQQEQAFARAVTARAGAMANPQFRGRSLPQ